MPRPRPERGRGDDGFTLVEALTAFAIVAMLTLVIQRGLVQARLGWEAIEERRAAERLARSLLSEPVSLPAVLEGGRNGYTDGRRWQIRLAALDLPLPDPPSPPATVATAGGQPPAPASTPEPKWQPLRVTITVETARGRPVEVETVRLAPVPPDDRQRHRPNP